MVLRKHSEQATLIHITAKENVESILKNGIKPSEFGDLEINGNDGFGVYAVKSFNKHDFLFEILQVCDEELCAIHFTTPGEWYECIEDEMPEDYDDPDNWGSIHVGYIVLPYHVPASCIQKIEKI